MIITVWLKENGRRGVGSGFYPIGILFIKIRGEESQYDVEPIKIS